jgi:threonine dehydrogenase-like Zn-dependent dehydrogenase
VGAVGLCGAIASRRLGTDQIIILARRPDRTDLARELGATDVVSERGDEAVERVRELTAGFGVRSVLECVGLADAMRTAIDVARPGGAVGRVGVPQDESVHDSVLAYFENVSIGGGLARSAPTWRSCSRTSWKDGSNPAGSSTASRASMRCPTATGR